jgi:hypothetical protein
MKREIPRTAYACNLLISKIQTFNFQKQTNITCKVTRLPSLDVHCIFQRYLADWVPSEALEIYQKINRCSLEISFFKPSCAVFWSSILADESRTRITPRERPRYKILNRRLGSENRARTLGGYVYFFGFDSHFRLN